MKKSRLVLLVSGTLLLGIILGAVGAGLICMHFAKEGVGIDLAASALQEVTELNSIQDGHPNDAKESLEAHLDADIIILGGLLENVPPGRRDPILVNALERARGYRLSYPYKADSPENQILITKALDLVPYPPSIRFSGQTNH